MEYLISQKSRIIILIASMAKTTQIQLKIKIILMEHIWEFMGMARCQMELIYVPVKIIIPVIQLIVYSIQIQIRILIQI